MTAKQPKLTFPMTWHKNYDEDAITKTKQILIFLNENNLPVSWLYNIDAQQSSRRRFEQLMQGTYPSRHHQHLNRILDYINIYKERQKLLMDGPFYEKATMVRIINQACRIARKRRTFTMVSAYVGTGKTRAILEYGLINANTFLIESFGKMSAHAMLNVIIDRAGIRLRNDERDEVSKLKTCINYFQCLKSPLIIVDEAETVSPNMLHALRRIRDIGKVGVVLVGTEKLEQLVMPTNYQGDVFDQINSRITFKSINTKVISEKDADGVLRLHFPDHEIDRDTFAAFWRHSQGSMRVLVEDVIENVKDFGTERGKPLTADVVHDICKKTLAV